MYETNLNMQLCNRVVKKKQPNRVSLNQNYLPAIIKKKS